MVTILLKQGADFEAWNKKGMTPPLHYSFQKFHKDNGCKGNNSPEIEVDFANNMEYILGEIGDVYYEC